MIVTNVKLVKTGGSYLGNDLIKCDIIIDGVLEIKDVVLSKNKIGRYYIKMPMRKITYNGKTKQSYSYVNILNDEVYEQITKVIATKWERDA